MTTTLILTRHGHVEGIQPERFRGRADLPLTALGVRQAQALRDRIVEGAWRPAAVYASPMSRAVRTGETVAEAFGTPVESMAGLNDIDYGAWQGLTPDEVRARWPDDLALWRNAPHLAAMPDGESLHDVAARATTALHEILFRHPGQTIVAVGHDSLNRVLLLHALDLPLSHYWSITQAPCTLNVIEFDGARFFVRTLNETHHLFLPREAPHGT